MKNALVADLLRVQRKKSFIIMLILELVLIVLMGISVFFLPLEGVKDNNFVMYTSAGAALSSLMVGIPIFLAAFADDFRSRALHTAIGFGLSRAKLILARYIEALILLLETLVFMEITVFVLGMIGGFDMNIIGDALLSSAKTMIPVVCYFSISMILVYATQSGTFALVMYILVAGDIFGAILTGVSRAVPFLAENNLHLEYIMPGSLINTLALNPDFNYGWAIWIVVIVGYVIFPVWLTTVLFRKKELEF